MLAWLTSRKFKAETPLLAFILFSLHSLSQAQTTASSYEQVSALESHVHTICKDVIEKGKTTTSLTENDLATLPLGIARETPSGTFVIAIDSAYSERGGWFFSAYASVTLPGAVEPIAFAAKNIAFNDGGLSTSTQVKLILVSTKSIQLNDNITIELPADGHNYIEWDCNGFKAINLKGNFLFSKGLLTPDPELAKDSTQVKASFEVNTHDLQNILLSVTITPFQIRGLDDLSFEVKQATADFSDIVNPPGFIFPQDYQQSFGAGITLWRGFYLGEVDIRLKNFSGEQGHDPTIAARNLLIDDQGVSGTFTASNILSLQNGSADGWPFSVGQISVKLLFSKVAGGSLAGLLNIPFLGDDPVAYTALMEQVDNKVNYRFSIATGSDKVFNTPFAAKITISKGSIISLEKRGGRFIPSTTLNGFISTDGKIKTTSIKFERLGLTTQKPYITSGVFSTVGSGQSRTAGFPVRIDSVNLRVFAGEAALGFGVSLNMMNASARGFSASTFVQLLVKMEETQVAAPPSDTPQLPRKKQEWKFDKVKVSDIQLSCQTTALTLLGRLSLFDDHPVYGNGFKGSLSLKIEKVMQKPVKVNAYFGSKETYRYWHVDAYVPTAKIPIIPPVLSIDGFMGGASYKMVRQQPFTPDFTKLNKEDVSAQGESSEIVYVPDEGIGMSFMAGVTLIGGSDKVLNADVMLEVAFNQGGGIRYAQFTGNAFFFTPIKNRGKSAPGTTVDAPVYASLNMLYDNDNNTFHANLKTYLNMAGILRGIGPGGLMGEAVIHVDPKDWYFYIGRPSQMFGVDVAKLAVAQAYFMIGTQIENMPPPPPEVLEVFDDIDPNTMQDATALRGGKGFATGAHFRVGFDSKDKLKPFYIMVAVGAGADIMLRDYGDAYCAGGNGRVGIDGWYASGQAYVFLKGKVGIKVKKREFDIVSLGAAALLQAKLPNPTWLKGQLGGSYAILGGLVKGKFNLKMEIGEECEIVTPGSELDNIVVIADIKPEVDATEVNVFTAPQVSFNTAIETEFRMPDMQDNPKSYRVRLQEFTLTKNGVAVQALLEWNANKDVAILRTHEILPPQSSLKATVKVYWEKKNERGIWETMKENGQTAYEVKEATFTTGVAPNFIPEENVAYSYPVRQQYNFHVNESGSGYVKLGQGQEYLFLPGEDGSRWTYFARFQDASRKIIETPLNYNALQKLATFTIPSNLARQSIQKLFFIKRPSTTEAVDQNVQRTETQVNAGAGNETTVASNTLEGTITQNVEKELYATVFRTSQFGTFQEKWSALSGGGDVFDVAIGYVAVIGKRGNLPETFDEVELKGIERKTSPLLQVIASTETPWLQNTIGPLLYDSYPIDPSVTISWRTPSTLGVMPLKGVNIRNTDNLVYKLTDTDVVSGTAPSKSGAILVNYFLSYYCAKDHNDLQNKAAAKYLNNWTAVPEVAKKLLSTGYTDLLDGYYPVDITYALPGTNQVTFRQRISIKY